MSIVLNNIYIFTYTKVCADICMFKLIEYVPLL